MAIFFFAMLPSVKFAEEKVRFFFVLGEKCYNSASLSLTLILTLITSADWSDKSEWYRRTVHCKTSSRKERTQTSGEMGIGCQRNGHRLWPIICRVMLCAANQGVVVCGREVCC